MKYFFWILFGALLLITVTATGFWNSGHKGSYDYVPFSEVKDSQIFTLPNLKGGSINFENVLKDNKLVLLSFWTTWCPYCDQEVPGLNKIQEGFEGQSVTVLGVNVGEPRDKVARYAERMGLKYPIALDEDGRVSERFRVIGIPTNYLIAQNGKVLGQYQGVTNELLSDIRQALAT